MGLVKDLLDKISYAKKQNKIDRENKNTIAAGTKTVRFRFPINSIFHLSHPFIYSL